MPPRKAPNFGFGPNSQWRRGGCRPRRAGSGTRLRHAPGAASAPLRRRRRVGERDQLAARPPEPAAQRHGCGCRSSGGSRGRRSRSSGRGRGRPEPHASSSTTPADPHRLGCTRGEHHRLFAAPGQQAVAPLQARPDDRVGHSRPRRLLQPNRRLIRGAPICRQPRQPTDQCTYFCTHAPMHPCTNAPMLGRTDTPMHRCRAPRRPTRTGAPWRG